VVAALAVTLAAAAAAAFLSILQPANVNAQLNCQPAVTETHGDQTYEIEYCVDGAYMTNTESGERVFLNERNCSIGGDERVIVSSCEP